MNDGFPAAEARPGRRDSYAATAAFSSDIAKPVSESPFGYPSPRVMSEKPWSRLEETMLGVEGGGVIVLPRDIADELAVEAVETTACENFGVERVRNGATIIGLSPL